MLEPAVFPNGRHRIEYTDVFKYLGCCIVPQLTDKHEIIKRIRQAKNQIGALLTFFSTSADLLTKRLVFQAIPLNTVLYGCETWALTVLLKQKVSAFFHTALRQILNINMHHVQEYRIRNEHVRNFFSVPDIMDTVHAWQFKFFGKVARMDKNNMQHKFMTAWLHSARPVGRLTQTLRHLHVETLQEILGQEISTTAKLSEWIELTTPQWKWKTILTKWMNARKGEMK